MADLKERIAGSAFNTMRALEKMIKDKRTKFGDWQVEFFEPGQPLEEYYPDQVQFVHGIIFDYGGFTTSRPIGRLDLSIQREAMKKQREIDTLAHELDGVLGKVARKLSIKKGMTVYRDQIDLKTGEIKELPADVRLIDIDIDETDAETIAAIETTKSEKSKSQKLLEESGDMKKES